MRLYYSIFNLYKTGATQCLYEVVGGRQAGTDIKKNKVVL